MGMVPTLFADEKGNFIKDKADEIFKDTALED